MGAMLTGLNAPPGALVIMDAGISSEANIDWLRTRGFRYFVVIFTPYKDLKKAVDKLG